jgi:hypothetical protein
MVFATLIGGTKREHHSAITVDDEGYIYIAGGTQSPDFPVTDGVFDTSFNGEGSWAGDVFVTKLDPTGSKIIYSTFLGGEVEETLSSGGIKVDSKGNVIVVGMTKSHNFPLTRGNIADNEKMNGFVTKLSAGAKKLLFSAVFGSSTMESVTSVDIDDEDNIYLSGSTITEGLPVTDNAFRKKMIMPSSGGVTDHYIVKLSGADHKILYFSYFVTDGFAGSPIAWIKPNKLTVCGSTRGKSFPASANAISDTVKGRQDGYIAVFNSETMELEYATLFGGSELERVQSAGFINEHTVAIGGTTSSADLPITGNALYPDFPVCEKSFNSSFLGRKKSFVAIVDVENGKLLNSTYFGASFLFNIFPDMNGNISFVAEAGQRGEAGITGFPLTKNAEEPPTYTMIGRFLLNAFPEPTKEELYKDVQVTEAVLGSYVGKYKLSPGMTLTVVYKDNKLILQIPNQGETQLLPKSQNEFFIKGSEYEFYFNVNDASEIESMTMHPDGGDNVNCKKIEE